MLSSFGGMGAVMSNMVLGSAGENAQNTEQPTAMTPQVKWDKDEKEDTLVMDTKLKIIEILQVCIGYYID